MSYFVTNEVILKVVPRGWLVETPIIFHDAKTGQEIEVPAQFFTDLASVPKLAQAIVPVANAKNRQAAIVHDYLCYPENREKYGLTQRDADRIFREAMAVCNVGWFGRWALWTPVRIYQWWKHL